jgi:hypothetical protein
MLADAWSVIDVFNFDFVNCYADMQIDGGTVKTGMILYQATNTPGYLQFYSQSSSTGLDFWFDNVLVRNWRATGPAWGAWGAEESN